MRSVNAPRTESAVRIPAGQITFLQQLIQQAAPLLSEEVGARQAAVPTNHAQVGDAALHQVERRFESALVGAELFTAGAADDGATLRRTRHSLFQDSGLC